MSRVVCERVNGPAPTEKHETAHGCGNSWCVNKRHLRWATHIENEADKLIHGTRKPSRPRCRAVKSREQDIQRAILDYIAAVCPDCLAWACPNASRRTKTGKATNAVPGLRRGVFDLSVILPDGRFVAVEIKTSKGYLSEEQEAFADELTSRGVMWCVLRSVEEARSMLAHYGVKTREAA